MRIPESVPWRSIGKTLGSGGQGVVEIVTRKDELDGLKYALKKLRNVESCQAESAIPTRNQCCEEDDSFGNYSG